MPGTPRKSGEFERIARYFAPLAAGEAGALGLRDDVAFLTVPDGQELVATSDALVSGVHFLPDDPPDLIARKALRVNLSDLAAKGAHPRWYLLDAAFTRKTDDRWIARFARGLAKDQAAFDVHLVGGDTVATPGPTTFAITALGMVRATWGLRRGGAHAGDDVFVTGTIGDAALGLMVRRKKLRTLKPTARAFLEGRYRLPQPRVAVGPRLLGVATAALDVSDGLVADLGHLAANSKLGAVIEQKLVPLSPATAAAVAKQPALMERVLTGGDDYEILFTAPASADKLLGTLSRETGVPITRIGRMEPGKGVRVIDTSGRPRRLAAGGWTHS